MAGKSGQVSGGGQAVPRRQARRMDGGTRCAALAHAQPLGLRPLSRRGVGVPVGPASMSREAPVKRFVITVVAATVLHAVACILMPPFEFAPTRPACFFYAMVSGLMVFPVIFAVLLLPLGAALPRLAPRATP